MGRPRSDLDEYLDWQERLDSFDASGMEIDVFWDWDGFCISYKRLERGTFQLLTTSNDEEGMELDYSQLVKISGGLDLRTGRRRRRYHRAP